MLTKNRNTDFKTEKDSPNYKRGIKQELQRCFVLPLINANQFIKAIMENPDVFLEVRQNKSVTSNSVGLRPQCLAYADLYHKNTNSIVANLKYLESSPTQQHRNIGRRDRITQRTLPHIKGSLSDDLGD